MWAGDLYADVLELFAERQTLGGDAVRMVDSVFVWVDPVRRREYKTAWSRANRSYRRAYWQRPDVKAKQAARMRARRAAAKRAVL